MKRDDKFTFDARPSARTEDENGFLHVVGSHITKAVVNPYYGREIPGWKEEGLRPDAVYYGFRSPEELKKSVLTWSGLPLHIEHHLDSADEPAKMTRVGAVGTARWDKPYIDADLTIWDGAAIDAVKDGSFRELSCAYRYDPDFTPGQYEGIDYDFVMRNIRGNHVALVEEGRAGHDVVVADAAFEEDKHTRDKSGKFCNGGGGYASITITGKELGEYRDVKELRQKAVTYYKEHLQGKPAYREDVGEIRFNRRGRDETKTYSADPDKLLMVPALRNIIEKGTLGKEEPLNHPRKDGIVAFVPITKTVSLKGKPREVEILLGKDRQGSLYYDLFLDNSRQARGKNNNPLSRTLSQNQGVTGDTGEAPVTINIRILPENVNTTTNKQQKPTYDKKTTGETMNKIRKWFRGAFDADPDTEKKEVDLAQAIIDLHKVDPTTGEVVDVTEDEDKAANIRELVDKLAAKLDPDEVKQLTDSLTDLAYSPAAGDSDSEEEEIPVTDEDMKEAMDACGLDADDPDHAKAFAEGVKYGESLEKNPRERDRLDSEHESEGLKKAMGDCGLDEENPMAAKAFAEGVKYGEEKGKDADPDTEEMAEEEDFEPVSDDDRGPEIDALLDEVVGLNDDQKAQLKASIQELLVPAVTDADPESEPAVEGAQDRAFRRIRRTRTRTCRGAAFDSARIKAAAVAEAKAHLRQLNKAVADVRPLVGSLDPLAFDSASDVYGYALTQKGFNAKKYPRAAWRGMVDAIRSHGVAETMRNARGVPSGKYDGSFAGLNNITIAD